jgi:ABC-type multidrug transport system ATPase subunit
LTAVIGPSGAGKSTLIKVLAGVLHPTAGRVRFGDHDVHQHYDHVRALIGLVPQQDIVHQRLTVHAALTYAAELRLPNDTDTERRRAVDRVLAELHLTEHRHTRVDRLSGGQRKRASVAMELLTSPSLLILDEPTSGLDPALDRQVMRTLRRLANAGRVVVVVTHSLNYVELCDQIVLLAPGGKTACTGTAAEVATAMGTADWADIYAWISANPDRAHQAHLERSSAHAAPAPRAAGAPDTPRCGSLRRIAALYHQSSTVARRQFRLIHADRGYLLFLALLPFILGGLSRLVSGTSGLGPLTATAANPNEASQILVLLTIGATFMGSALSVRDLVGERAIFLRERCVGLSISAYLAAKCVVYSIISLAQVGFLTTVALVGRPGPNHPTALLLDPMVELYAALTLTAICSACFGLALSALAHSNDQVLPMLVTVMMLSIVFCGGLIPMADRLILDQASWLVPARWGFAATAATVDLRAIAPLAPAGEYLWSPTAATWLRNIAVLLGLSVAAVGFAGWRLRRLRSRCPQLPDCTA